MDHHFYILKPIKFFFDQKRIARYKKSKLVKKITKSFWTKKSRKTKKYNFYGFRAGRLVLELCSNGELNQVKKFFLVLGPKFELGTFFGPKKWSSSFCQKHFCKKKPALTFFRVINRAYLHVISRWKVGKKVKSGNVVFWKIGRLDEKLFKIK